jgi:hypothetical protein
MKTAALCTQLFLAGLFLFSCGSKEAQSECSTARKYVLDDAPKKCEKNDQTLGIKNRSYYQS